MKHLMTLLVLFCAVTAVAQVKTTLVGEKALLTHIVSDDFLYLDTISFGSKHFVRIIGPNGWDGTVFYADSIEDKIFTEKIRLDCGQYTVRFDGHDYSTVEIGNQCWFAENLRTTRYRNGDEIPFVSLNQNWEELTSDAQIIYGVGPNPCFDEHCNESENLELHGRLYNWYAISDSRAVCPFGWKVPSRFDWEELVNIVGVYDAGKVLKSSPTDVPAFDGLNSAGFNGAAGGVVDSGVYSDIDVLGNWWSSSFYSGDAPYFFELYVSSDMAQNSGTEKTWGLSVRCLRE